MMKKTEIVLGAVLAFAVISSGCSKLTSSTTGGASQQTGSTVMQQSLSLPSPDNSYSVMQSSQILSSGFNVGSVLIPEIFDKVAIALRETNMHLYQTMTQGTSSNSGLTIALSSLGTNLTATVNSAQASLSYVYTVNGSSYATNSTYFTANVQSSGVSGNLSFPGGSSSAPLSVTFNEQGTGSSIVLNTTVVNSSWGSLSFVETYANGGSVPSSVQMNYTISSVSGTGTWSQAAGGSFTDLGGTKRCFNSSLQDVTPCN